MSYSAQTQMQPEANRSYTAEVDGFSAEQWYAYLDGFADANLYQTWHWGATFSPGRVSTLVLKRDGEVVAMAQIRLFPAGPWRGGIAFTRWGPVWQLKGQSADAEVLRQAMRAPYVEYVTERKMVLRVLPRLFLDNGDHIAILQQEGYRLLEDRKVGRTLLIDITPSLEQLRANFIGKWRTTLNSAEKQGFTIHVGDGTAEFEGFAGVYRAMLDRKKFDTNADLEGHQQI
jgi:lipid II:glycine glycyltransferase (peptidoglycan interpeptide bridge formation enzyme)